MRLKQLVLLAVIVIKVLSAAENDLPLFSDGRTITNPTLPPCFLRISEKQFDPQTGITSIYTQYPSVIICGSSYAELCNRTALFCDFNPYIGTTLNAAYLR